jgi:hypothetical protein
MYPKNSFFAYKFDRRVYTVSSDFYTKLGVHLFFQLSCDISQDVSLAIKISVLNLDFSILGVPY